MEGGAIRSYYLATALMEAGHEVTIITAHKGAEYVHKIIAGIQVHYLPIAYDNRFGFIARSQSFIKYALRASRMASTLKGFDYCYAISVPLTVGLAAMWIKRRDKLPFIFEVGDLWPDAPIQMGVVNNYFFKKTLFSLEKKIYQAAHSIVALSPAIQSAIEKKVSGKKVHLIPNMADCEFYKPEIKDPEFEAMFGVQGKFVVSYIGALGVANGLDYVIECARASQSKNLPVHFMLCGDGAVLDRLVEVKKNLQLDNLTITPFQNREGVKTIMNLTDASFICYKPVSILETGSPNKYFDGLAAGKLIVINFGGWIREEIEKNQCGVFVNPHDAQDFVNKITPFLEGGKILNDAQGAARLLAESSYSRKELSRKFATLFK